MIPRGAPYISWMDLAAATLWCAVPGNAVAARRRLEARWAPNTVAFLSVRSGLDALLGVWSFPPGSEIVVSAITIPHILEIFAHHRLVAVPVDIDLPTLSVDSAALERAITPNTRAILVAHLFGRRMPLDDIAAIARTRSLPLIEDCAQALDGSDYRGHPDRTVSMFSFGSIKRQTALGGGLLSFRDPGLAASVAAAQATYPRQTRLTYLRRVFTMTMIKLVAIRSIFSAFVAVCRWRGRDHDRTLGTALRGFVGGNLMTRLRHQPSGPLLRVLERRLRQSPLRSIAQRVAVVRAVTAEYPQLRHPGSAAANHSHWLFPMMTAAPDQRMHALWARGYDATGGASNLVCVPPLADRPAATQALRLMEQVLYLPLYPGASSAEMRGMARTLRDLDRG